MCQVAMEIHLLLDSEDTVGLNESMPYNVDFVLSRKSKVTVNPTVETSELQSPW